MELGHSLTHSLTQVEVSVWLMAEMDMKEEKKSKANVPSRDDDCVQQVWQRLLVVVSSDLVQISPPLASVQLTKGLMIKQSAAWRYRPGTAVDLHWGGGVHRQNDVLYRPS